VKQTGRPFNSSQPPSLPLSLYYAAIDNEDLSVEADRGEEAGTRTSELVHLTAATVSMDSSGVRGDNSRGRRSVSWRRRKNRTARQQRMLLSAVESLHSVEHESSQLIVVSGRLDGRRCRDILVDPGASSNFVRRDWALSQRLSVQQLKTPLDVTLADTRKVSQVTGCVAVRRALPLLAS
jgi:hypothetical protein